MAMTLNHTIVPARDKDASAKFFAEIFGLDYEESGHFAVVRVNPTLTFDFSDADRFESHHYAFRVDDAELEAILERVKAAAVPYGSDPWHLENGELNTWHGGRGFYFRDPNGHILELMTGSG